MKLVDMKRSKKETKDRNKVSCSPDSDPYGYGMCIRLEDEDLQKLGITTLPKVGGRMNVEAVCKVISASQSADSYGKRRSVELQITKLGLTSGAASVSDAIDEGIDSAAAG